MYSDALHSGVRECSRRHSERGNLPEHGRTERTRWRQGSQVRHRLGRVQAYWGDSALPVGQRAGASDTLAIAHYERQEGFYLFYLDAEGAVATDTFHDSVDGALGLAAFEYDGLRWLDVS